MFHDDAYVGESYDEAVSFKLKLDGRLPSKKNSNMYLVEIFGRQLYCVALSASSVKVNCWDYLFHKDSSITDISKFRIANEGRQITLPEYVEEIRDSKKEQILKYLKDHPELIDKLLKGDD